MVYHHRRLILGLLLGLCLLIPSTSVLADDPVVEITVSAWVIGYPSGFTITYVNDNQVDIAWTPPDNSANTMVRAASGHVPADRADGYQVYLGDGDSCSDTALTLASPEIVYYRAWNEDADDGWGPLFASGDTEDFMSASFLFIGFILIAGLLTYFALKVNLMLFRLAGAMSWLGLGIWLLLSDSTNLQLSDTWTQVFGLLFLVMCIGVLSLQMKADVRHEASVRNVQGFPGSRTESYTTWGPKPKKHKETAMERQANYRKKLKGGR